MKKKLIINDEKDLNRFYNRLWLYRSFIYRFVYFYIDEDKYNVTPILKALNIKYRNSRIKCVINEACIYLDNYYKDKNYCDFRCYKCALHRSKKYNYKNGCCRACDYQSSEGCLTSNVACKLFYCKYITDKYDTLTIKDIKVLYVLSLFQRMTIGSDYFASVDDVAMDLYCWPLASTVRISMRMLKIYPRFRKVIKNEKL